jgi:hypothetical protein
MLYKQSLKRGERVLSSAKDLAGVMHQQGKTQEACTFLRAHAHLFSADREKYDNLLLNLNKQITPTGNIHKKWAKLTQISTEMTQEDILALFVNPSRI